MHKDIFTQKKKVLLNRNWKRGFGAMVPFSSWNQEVYVQLCEDAIARHRTNFSRKPKWFFPLLCAQVFHRDLSAYWVLSPKKQSLRDKPLSPCPGRIFVIQNTVYPLSSTLYPDLCSSQYFRLFWLHVSLNDDTVLSDLIREASG